MEVMDVLDALERHDGFVGRHIGPTAAEQSAMLEALDLRSLEELTARAVPAAIRRGYSARFALRCAMRPPSWRIWLSWRR